MASQNRGNYARYNAGGSRGLAVFRGAFILLTALTLSFGLGFFVIARMMPGGQSPNGGGTNSAPPPVTNHDSDQNHAPNARPAPTNPSSAPNAPASTTNPDADGPSILPDTNVQKPEKIDENGKHTSDSTQSSTTDPDDKNPSDHKTDSENDAQSAGDDSGDTTPSKSHRDRTASPPDEKVQPAGSPDATRDSDASGRSANSKKNGASDAESGPKDGLYRVQIGVFSTREKAEEVAKSAMEKGFEATVKTMTRDGRTLYKVQHSAYRDRVHAEQEQQRLLEAGFDASISNP